MFPVGHDGAMTVVEEAFGPSVVVVEFPRTGADDWIAVAEVLLQEGLSAWAFPVQLMHLVPEVNSLFGRRARVGVSGVTDAEGVRAAADVGARFILCPVAMDGLTDDARGIPLIAGALTPSEVADRARAGAEAVLVAPADALGSGYSRTLPSLFENTALVPWGRLERYQCEMWLEAGARAVVVSEIVVRPEDGAGINDVDEVSRRAAPFSQLTATPASEQP